MRFEVGDIIEGNWEAGGELAQPGTILEVIKTNYSGRDHDTYTCVVLKCPQFLACVGNEREFPIRFVDEEYHVLIQPVAPSPSEIGKIISEQYEKNKQGEKQCSKLVM